MLDNGTIIYNSLEIEKCEMGKNVNLKFNSYFEQKYAFWRELKIFIVLIKNLKIL